MNINVFNHAHWGDESNLHVQKLTLNIPYKDTKSIFSYSILD
jgi:hypothetical protein